MATKIYGASDDLLEIEGDVGEEYGCYGTDDEHVTEGLLVACSDGTVLTVKYGKGGMGVWGIVMHIKGHLFDRIDECNNPDADVYSDVAHFGDGLKWVRVARRCAHLK